MSSLVADMVAAGHEEIVGPGGTTDAGPIPAGGKKCAVFGVWWAPAARVRTYLTFDQRLSVDSALNSYEGWKNMALAGTGSVLDDRPLPWIIALGINPGSEAGEALLATGGDVAFCSSLDQVRQDDFDFLVCDQLLPSRAVRNDLDVLQLLPARTWGDTGNYVVGESRLSVANGSRASRFTVSSEAVEQGLKKLLDATVLNNIERASDYLVIAERDMGGGTVKGGRRMSVFTPLVSEFKGQALAGYLTNAENHQWWMLPPQVTGEASWVAAILEIWKKQRPEAFPPDATEPGDTWMTLAERRAHDRIREHAVETAKLLADREEELEGLKEAAQVATDAALEREQRLLFATGDDLVAAVAGALVRIGFEVVDADELAAADKRAKREDLQVKLSSESDWVSLVEVKGKTRAAATSDLAQLAKAGTFYEARTDHKPDAEWYIVNAYRDQPPSARPTPLGTSGEDVDYYAAADNAAVIDTRELFILLREVESGNVELAHAQESLRSARGIYTAPRGTNLVSGTKQTRD